MAGINSSVGKWEAKSANVPTDVTKVQELLALAAKQLHDPSLDPKGADGKIAKPPATSSTVSAILAFQKKVARLPVPDGRVDPNGKTWQALEKFAAAKPATPTGPPGTEYFPFSTMTAHSWTTGARRFAADRSGGKRAHAGCDLYYPKGTTIYAVAGGMVTRGPYDFYAQTSALEVDHGSFIVRYGEVQKATLVKEGDAVVAGQAIATVGHLVGITVPSDMLHFEMYGKSGTGTLTDKTASSAKRADGVSFQRRSDLIDPTTYLNKWSTNLPPK